MDHTTSSSDGVHCRPILTFEGTERVQNSASCHINCDTQSCFAPKVLTAPQKTCRVDGNSVNILSRWRPTAQVVSLSPSFSYLTKVTGGRPGGRLERPVSSPVDDHCLIEPFDYVFCCWHSLNGHQRALKTIAYWYFKHHALGLRLLPGVHASDGIIEQVAPERVSIIPSVASGRVGRRAAPRAGQLGDDAHLIPINLVPYLSPSVRGGVPNHRRTDYVWFKPGDRIDMPCLNWLLLYRLCDLTLRGKEGLLRCVFRENYWEEPPWC